MKKDECKKCNGDTLIFKRNPIRIAPCDRCSFGKSVEYLEEKLEGFKVSAHLVFEREAIKEHNERISPMKRIGL